MDAQSELAGILNYSLNRENEGASGRAQSYQIFFKSPIARSLGPKLPDGTKAGLQLPRLVHTSRLFILTIQGVISEDRSQPAITGQTAGTTSQTPHHFHRGGRHLLHQPVDMVNSLQGSWWTLTLPKATDFTPRLQTVSYTTPAAADFPLVRWRL